MIANLLTALRLALAAPVALTFALPGVMSAASLVAIILLAMATDVAAGRAARRYGTASSRGMLFDHVTNTQYAILFSNKIDIWSEPNQRGEIQFTLHEGTKIELLESLDEWNKIRIANGSEGWIKNADLRSLN